MIFEAEYGAPLLLLAAVFLLPFVKAEKTKQQQMMRKDQMMVDYPVIVMKLSLFLEAGMSLRSAWEAVIKGYEHNRGARRWAYEAMKTTLSGLKNGQKEAWAYGDFGRRCGVYPYLKLGCLLEQNLKLGGTNLAALLLIELEDAFEERRNIAVRKGQEAQSKLLLPMMVLLIISLAVVLAPAFLSISLQN